MAGSEADGRRLMMQRRELWKYLKFGSLALLPTISSAQQQGKGDDADSRLANVIGGAVLASIRQYEQKTGKHASTVVIHLTGALPQDASTGSDYTQLNQFKFTIEIEDTPTDGSK
jgi:hypothetical protein